jgi:homoserine dehydrogenase
MKKNINVGIIGLGTVGTGVVKLMKKNISLIEHKAGAKINIKRICDRDANRFKVLRKYGFSHEIFTNDADDIIQDRDIDIVIELIGGYEPARTFILSAITSGKHVVTANKALLAKYWKEIFKEANKHKVSVYIEASVGGGIPIIQVLNEGLSANRIKSILGILNGTTNYILTKMSSDKMDFKKALAEAKKHGFAEADASFDINGTDAANKLVVLGSIAFGAHIAPDEVYCEGIGKIMREDIQYAAEEFGYILKLLAILKNNGKVIDVRVHPTLIPKDHPLCSVEDEYNAVYVVGDASGDTMYYGRGAGEMPTASAVVSDVIYLSKNIHNDIAGKAPYIQCNPFRKLKIMDIRNISMKYYIRINSVDRPGVLSKISGLLGKHNVSIASVYQMAHANKKKTVPIVLVTHTAKEGDVKKALAEMDRLSIVKEKSIMIRIEDSDEGTLQ